MYKRTYLLLLIPFSLILTSLAKFNPNFAEFYSLKIYPKLAGGISFFTSKIKYSIAELLIIILALTLIIYLVFTFYKIINNKDISYFKEFILNIAVAGSVIYCLFVIFCGINYYRQEFTYYSGLEIKNSSKEELINLCEMLINDANDLRKELNFSDEQTTELMDSDYFQTAERAKTAFNNISQDYSVLKGNYPPPKIVLFSRVMSQFRITGVFFPFTFEANVNINIPPYQVPSTMLHELVHLRGFMREDEANFLSYLACINSGYTDFAYSGTMLALGYSMNMLYDEDYESYKKLQTKYSEEVINDLKFSSEYWKRFEGKAAVISNKINDSYLKANNLVDGVKSYGRMVDLLLAYYSSKVA